MNEQQHATNESQVKKDKRSSEAGGMQFAAPKWRW